MLAMPLTRAVSVLCLMILLTACATSTVEPSYYLLRSKADVSSGKLTPSRDYSLGTVEIAPYLDQPGVVMETADAQTRPASAHLWAEPMFDGVRNYLTTEISQATGYELLPSELNRNSTVVNIRIDQLHGTQGGTARIVAYWWLVRADQVVTLNRYADSRTLQANGYGALVDAEKTLLSELAKQVAASLVTPPT